MARHDNVLWIESDDEVIVIPAKSHQPFRTLYIKVNSNLSRPGGVQRRAYCFRLRDKMASGDSRCHDGGRNQRVGTNHVGRHADVIARNKSEQKC